MTCFILYHLLSHCPWQNKMETYTSYDYQHAEIHTLFKTKRKNDQNTFNRKGVEKCTRLQDKVLLIRDSYERLR